MSKLSLKTKLISAFAVVALSLLIVGGVSYYTLNNVARDYSHVAQINLPNVELIGEMGKLNWTIRARANQLVYETDEAKFNSVVQLLGKGMEQYLESDKRYQAVPFVEGEQALYDAQNAQWTKSKAILDEVVSLARQQTPESRQKFAQLLPNYFAAADAHDQALEDLVKFQSKEGVKWAAAAAQADSRGKMFLGLLIALGFLTSLGIGFVFATSLSKTFMALAQKLGGGADQVASAATQISSTSSELSASASEQAAALQETVASIDEVSAMVNKNADNAKQSQSYSVQSQDTATKGKQAVEEMISSIDDISRSNSEIMQQIETSNQQISQIVQVISEIGNKTKVINDIVFQTKLLSFNASVEAARAGEHGKGFAVVAEEVGNLAQMSGNAAKEISQMLESSIQKVESIVNETKSKVEQLIVVGKEKVETGTETARRCGEVLEDIVKNVGQVNQLIGEIATASHEQAQGVVEINKAMTQLDQVTQQNATASQQSASASEQLSAQAEELRGLVQGLLSTVNGAGHTQEPTFQKRPSKKTAKTLEFKRKETSSPRKSAGKVAAGGEDLPLENDPRFEDA